MGFGTRFVVCGAPGSGKTTYVQREAKEGDLVWDMDAVAKAINCAGVFPYQNDIYQLMLAWRRTLLESISLQKRRMYIIVADRESAGRIARKIGGTVVDVEQLRKEEANGQTRTT